MKIEYVWRQTAEGQYVIHHGEDVIASIAKQGASTTTALGETPNGTFTLRRTGSIRTRVSVTADEVGAEVASLAKERREERVQLVGGELFTCKSLNDPKGSWAFMDDRDGEVMLFTESGSATEPGGTVRVDDSRLTDSAASLLLMLGLFRTSLKQSDDDATILGSLAAVIAST